MDTQVGAMTILEVLNDIRASALSEAEKGSKFGLLIQAWLAANPTFVWELRDVGSGSISLPNISSAPMILPDKGGKLLNLPVQVLWGRSIHRQGDC